MLSDSARTKCPCRNSAQIAAGQVEFPAGGRPRPKRLLWPGLRGTIPGRPRFATSAQRAFGVPAKPEVAGVAPSSSNRTPRLFCRRGGYPLPHETPCYRHAVPDGGEAEDQPAVLETVSAPEFSGRVLAVKRSCDLVDDDPVRRVHAIGAKI